MREVRNLLAVLMFVLCCLYLIGLVIFRWIKLAGTDLLPGDVVSIGRSSGPTGEDRTVPADMLILAGSAIVNEAILTGESTPQWKVIASFQTHYNIYCCRRLFS